MVGERIQNSSAVEFNATIHRTVETPTGEEITVRNVVTAQLPQIEGEFPIGMGSNAGVVRIDYRHFPPRYVVENDALGEEGIELPLPKRPSMAEKTVLYAGLGKRTSVTARVPSTEIATRVTPVFDKQKMLKGVRG